jgi:hypothetical protein
MSRSRRIPHIHSTCYPYIRRSPFFMVEGVIITLSTFSRREDGNIHQPVRAARPCCRYRRRLTATRTAHEFSTILHDAIGLQQAVIQRRLSACQARSSRRRRETPPHLPHAATICPPFGNTSSRLSRHAYACVKCGNIRQIYESRTTNE